MIHTSLFVWQKATLILSLVGLLAFWQQYKFLAKEWGLERHRMSFFETLSDLLIVIATMKWKNNNFEINIHKNVINFSPYFNHCVNEYIAMYKSLENSYCALYLCDVLFYYQKSIDLNHRRAHIKAKETDIFSPRISFSIPASRFTSLWAQCSNILSI